MRWEFGGIRAGQQFVPFGELATSCWMNRVQLSAAGFYKTPKIHWDRATGSGRPFYYFAYGAGLRGGDDRHADRRVSASTAAM